MGVFPHLAARAVSEGISLGKLGQELEAATTASAEHAAPSLRMCRCILTHSASRACLETLVRWWRAGREVVVTESRPKREGIAMARHLAQRGMRVRLISDAGMGWCVAQCDAVLVGADAIDGDGVLINKTGTRLAVLAARDAGIPAYAVTQTHKICPPGWPLALMPQEPADLVRASGPRVANVVFDATPLPLFTEVFTEGGRLTRALLGRVQQRLPTDVLLP
jgi:translation initiation factor 2B subunit (eIF-2B alpha/beta/delta family)